MTKRFFVVTGMHRSGTSVVSRIVNLLGADLGPEAQMLSVNFANPKGYWENTSMVALHDDLLAHLGGAWDHPPNPAAGWERSPDLDDYRRRAIEIVDSMYGEGELAAWKDPRASLLLPFWGTIIDIAGTILCLRHPAEVAASLEHRNGFSTEHSAYLWLRYTSAAYRARPGHLLVHNDDLYDDFDGVISRISSYLGVGSPDEARFDNVRQALDPVLRHHHGVPAAPGSAMDAAMALYDLIRATEPAPATHDAASGERRLTARLGTALDEYAAALYEAGQELDAARSVQERQTIELADAAREGDRLARELIERDVQIDSLRSDLGGLRSRIDALVVESNRRRSDLEAAQREHQMAEQELQQVFASTSWRLTAPIRLIGDAFPSLARVGRRMIKLLWWTVTLQIFTRLPEYLRWRRAQRAPGSAGTDLERPGGPATMASELKFFTEPGPRFEAFDPSIASEAPIRATLLAFYLPQFHAIPENDEWWGEGFTEWRNLSRSTPRFVGHYQPRIPRDLGYYDLADSRVMRRQIDLAKSAGITGFCFYYYMFDQGPLLEKPLESLLADPTLDMPFSLMWCNENWTRTWDGLDDHVLRAQTYRPELEDRLLADFARYFRDDRYIRIGDRPLLIIYRPGSIPDTKARIARWRERLAADHGFEPWILMAQGFGDEDPLLFGLDGAVEFPPHKLAGRAPEIRESLELLDPEFGGHVRSYADVAEQALVEPPPDYPLIRTVVPSWDNDARRPGQGLTLAGSSPERYEHWLRQAIELARTAPFAGEPLVFVNAWNEWAEAAYLEPDVHFGSAYLNATARALVGAAPPGTKPHVLLVGHDAHEHGAQLLLLNIGRVLTQRFGVDVTYLLLHGGGLVDRYREVGNVVIAPAGTPEFASAVAELARTGVHNTITNTTVTGAAVETLKDSGFRVVSLIHELPGLIGERGLDSAAKAIARTSDVVVFPSDFVAGKFRSVTEADIDRAVVLPQGLYHPPRVSDGDRSSIGEELDLPSDAKIVLGVGYGDLRKGIDLFVAAAKLAQTEHPDFHFVWVGRLDAEIGRWLVDDADDSNLHVVGYADDVSRYYGGADVFFLSSREDPFPSTVLEALAAGLPVIGFAETTGSQDLITRHGLLVEQLSPSAALAAITAAMADADDAAAAADRRDTIAADHDLAGYVFRLLQLAEPDVKKVSVVVPNYNYARHLEERLSSIFEQTYPVYEIIVLDDASTDASVEEVERVASEYSRELAIVVNERNSGSIIRQWLRGATLATGDYLWIAEADDLAKPIFLEAMVGALRPDSVNMAFSDSIQIDADGRQLADSYAGYFALVDDERFRSSFVMDGPDFLEKYLSIKNLMLNVSGMLFRTEALAAVLGDGLDELASFTFAGDWQTYANLCLTGKVAFVAEPINVHRRHRESATHRASGAVHLEEIARVQRFVADTLDVDDRVLREQEEYRRWVAERFGVGR